MKKNIFLTLLLLGLFIPAAAQDISSHQWKDRVLIVLTTDTSAIAFKQQVQLFKNNLSGLKERKLQIYFTTHEAYKVFNSGKESWSMRDSLYKKYKSGDSTMEVVLIGLDGGIKHRKYSLTPMEEIFVIIDGMPMRQSEIQTKKKGNP